MVDLLPCLLHKSRFATGKHAACGGFGAVRGRVCPVSTGDAVALTSCRWSRGQNPGPPPSLRILSRWPELTRTTPQGTPRLERGLRTPQTSELPPGEGSGVWSRGSALPCQRRPPAALSRSRTHVRAHTRAHTHTPRPWGSSALAIAPVPKPRLGGDETGRTGQLAATGPCMCPRAGGRSEGPRGAVSSSRPCCGQSGRDEIKEPPGLGVRWPGWGRWAACGALGCRERQPRVGVRPESR